MNRFPIKKKKEVIFVGRIVKEKGVDGFVEAIKEIYNSYNDWEFKIIGSPKLGVNKLDNFSRIIKQKFENIGSRTFMLGFINTHDLGK